MNVVQIDLAIDDLGSYYSPGMDPKLCDLGDGPYTTGWQVTRRLSTVNAVSIMQWVASGAMRSVDVLFKTGRGQSQRDGRVGYGREDAPDVHPSNIISQCMSGSVHSGL